MAAIGWLRAFKSTMTSFGSLAISPINASPFAATFTSTPSCLAVSASFIWKNKSSISATTLPILLRLFFNCCSTTALLLCAGSSQRCLLPGKMQLRNETMSAHPENARLAASGPRDVTLYTRPGCHLCDEAKSAITPLLREFGASLREVNIDADIVLKERYGWDVPVIFIGPKKAAKHHLDLEQFRRQIRDAVAG